MKEYDNVNVVFNSEVNEVKGDKNVTAIEIKNKKTGKTEEIKVDGIFVEIGLIPNSDFAKDILNLNEYNEINVDCACRTNIPGIFAAGDVTAVLYKQIIIAAGEGAKAALIANEYILKDGN